MIGGSGALRMHPTTGGGSIEDIDNLMRYYDYHQQPLVRKWDSSNVDWADFGLDVAGGVLGFFALNEVAYSLKVTKSVQDASALGSSTANALSLTTNLADQDGIGVMLSVVGFIPGPPGIIASGASAIYDLNAGFYDQPWVPSIPR
jgi:hypothetical protein